MKLHTSRFGEMDIEKEKVLDCPHGILGFPDVKQYILLDHMNKPEVPFKWLQAVDTPELAFVITDPLLFYPEYNPEISEQDLKELDIADSVDRSIIVIVTIPHGEPEKMTANLQGPIMINLKTRKAKQLVLTGESYPIQYPLTRNIPESAHKP